MPSSHLVQPPDVVLSEHAAQSLVEAVSCPSEAVLVAAGPAAPSRVSAEQRSGKRHKNQEKPDSFHGYEYPGILSSSVYQKVCSKAAA